MEAQNVTNEHRQQKHIGVLIKDIHSETFERIESDVFDNSTVNKTNAYKIIFRLFHSNPDKKRMIEKIKTVRLDDGSYKQQLRSFEVGNEIECVPLSPSTPIKSLKNRIRENKANKDAAAYKNGVTAYKKIKKYLADINDTTSIVTLGTLKTRRKQCTELGENNKTFNEACVVFVMLNDGSSMVTLFLGDYTYDISMTAYVDNNTAANKGKLVAKGTWRNSEQDLEDDEEW
ncbi:hypothetical protein C942_00484 [Photobacterium marinum]|uniref:Uncharacterized protein n=1 Tax=Photobacterium marinum TaxID=1056511 RepID=L8JF44_9GAMM|nr:hypothetical protein [Photobacterium marinum]ELR66042.1 hypothetical protein C942_00484 [Photobacterium marinum]